MMSRKNYHGFTLIEVLVALSVLAIALTAVLVATYRNINNIQGVIDRSTAHWVSLNVSTELELGLLPLPIEKKLAGKMFMLNKTWYWTAIAQPSKNPQILEIIVTVTDKPQANYILARLMRFMRP